VPPNANPAVWILIRVKAANVTAGIGQACITSYCKTRVLNAKCLTPIRKYHTGQSEVEHRLAFRNNLLISLVSLQTMMILLASRPMKWKRSVKKGRSRSCCPSLTGMRRNLEWSTNGDWGHVALTFTTYSMPCFYTRTHTHGAMRPYATITAPASYCTVFSHSHWLEHSFVRG